MNIEQQFLQALQDSFEQYQQFGARSNKKLIPIHSWLAKIIINNLGDTFKIHSLGYGKEIKLLGKYYQKTLDIAITKEEKTICTISFKFVTSNYKQNSNNYFENLLGECANIRRVNVGFAHFLVLRANTPYYEKNTTINKIAKKTEVINAKDLKKYLELIKELDLPHKPDLLTIAIIDFDSDNKPYLVNLEQYNFSKEDLLILQSHGINNFVKKITALCQLKA